MTDGLLCLTSTSWNTLSMRTCDLDITGLHRDVEQPQRCPAEFEGHIQREIVSCSTLTWQFLSGFFGGICLALWTSRKTPSSVKMFRNRKHFLAYEIRGYGHVREKFRLWPLAKKCIEGGTHAVLALAFQPCSHVRRNRWGRSHDRLHGQQRRFMVRWHDAGHTSDAESENPVRTFASQLTAKSQPQPITETSVYLTPHWITSLCSHEKSFLT